MVPPKQINEMRSISIERNKKKDYGSKLIDLSTLSLPFSGGGGASAS
jgi:hypothetical protein